ncbi:MAG: peptide chain release factor N(5)-glutamine methyltransferase, partial [Alphaproteobacteria bacterium]
MRIHEALILARSRLSAAGIPAPGTDARLLVAHATGIAADRLLLHREDRLDDAAQARLEAALAERVARRPVA